jgi:ribonuclease P protein component
MAAARRAFDVLKRRADFLRVAAAGAKAVQAGVLLQAGPAARASPRLSVGFTASKKVGNAVARNRARRRLREAAHAVLPGEAPAGYDYVLVARSETVAMPYSRLLADLSRAVKRLKLAPRAAASPAPDAPSRERSA